MIRKDLLFCVRLCWLKVTAIIFKLFYKWISHCHSCSVIRSRSFFYCLWSNWLKLVEIPGILEQNFFFLFSTFHRHRLWCGIQLGNVVKRKKNGIYFPTLLVKFECDGILILCLLIYVHCLIQSNVCLKKYSIIEPIHLALLRFLLC